MNALDEIASRARAVMTIARRTGHENGRDAYPHTGELLTMTDGARWFHANDGADPVRITPENEAALRID